MNDSREMDKKLIESDWIQEHIYYIRGHKVMLSYDLPQLYEVEPRALVQAVKRNIERFPEDFMFLLENQELTNLKSQIVISSWGGARTPPYAFTEQGIAMLSGILSSSRAIKINIEIMRAFVGLRRLTISYKELSNKINQLEKKYDYQFKLVFDALRRVAKPAESKKRKIGIQSEDEE